ncbi:MAG: cupredoxin domain-containing protein [Chloroflexi bacterium]|nr:cupredoxin domain-containing protein [Chloroflexota bacterium]
MKRLRVMLVSAALLSAACFTAEATRVPEPEEIDPSQASADAVQVVVTDHRFDISTGHAKAGTIDFVVRNDADEPHEFVIVPRDGDRYGMPLGEIEPFEPGQTRALRAQLAPGSYEFVCLIIDVIDGEPKSHMSVGMKTGFEVTP